MLTRIAVAIDGSQASLAAVKKACAIGPDTVSIYLIAVKDYGAFQQEAAAEADEGVAGDDVVVFAKDWDHTARNAHKEAKAVLAACGRTAIWAVVDAKPGQGGPAKVFYQRALKDRADMILVGRHQGSAFVEGLLGSFPRWLVSHSALPVAVIPPPAEIPK